jgi:hypothetical protein
LRTAPHTESKAPDRNEKGARRGAFTGQPAGKIT